MQQPTGRQHKIHDKRSQRRSLRILVVDYYLACVNLR